MPGDTTTPNKVRFNLKNVHYAVFAASTGTWGTQVAIPGAVSLDLSPEGEMETFYADGIAYYVSNSNNGYSGSMEVARVPDSLYKDVFGVTEGTTSKVLTEHANVEPKMVALLFQIDGDMDNELYVLYACALARPNIASKTNEANKEVQTQTFDITAVPMADGKVLARTTAATPTATRTGWFTSVFEETTTSGEN